MLEDEQEKFLDDCLKIVKAQSYHIHQAIDRNNCRAVLKETAHMLLELKSSFLTLTTHTVSRNNLQTVFKTELKKIL